MMHSVIIAAPLLIAAIVTAVDVYDMSTKSNTRGSCVTTKTARPRSLATAERSAIVACPLAASDEAVLWFICKNGGKVLQQ